METKHGFKYRQLHIEDYLREILLFCKLDDAPLIRLNDGVSAWIERSYANYLRLFEQFH